MTETQHISLIECRQGVETNKCTTAFEDGFRAYQEELMGYSCITNGQMVKFIRNQENAYHHTHDI